MSVSRRPSQLDLFSRSAEVASTPSCLPSRTVGTANGSRRKSTPSCAGSWSDADVRARLYGISGSSSSRSAAVPTTTSCSGSLADSGSTSRTSAATGRTE